MKEVEEAKVEMVAGTTPGPNGFIVNFLHFFQDMVMEEVWKSVEDSRKNQYNLPAFNATFFSLIPKTTDVESLWKFRPISLCNVIYNIITRVIRNHLKPILPFIISFDK